MTGPAAEPQKNPSGSDETFNDTEKQVYGVPQDTKVNDALEMSPEEYKRIRTKIDIRILPYFSLLYLLSFLDRINIGQAKTAGLMEDLNLSTQDFQIALTLFFVSYVVFEIPSNLALKLLKPHRWITLIVFLWGVTMTLMGLCTNAAGLITARWFLGMFEGGLFPGLNFLLTAYYSREQLNLRVGIFFAGATLSGAFGGLLAYGIRQMDGVGGKGGWSWIFILEGLLTLVVGLPCWWLIPDFPDDQKSFLTAEEKAKWLHHLKKSQGVSNTPLPFSWGQIFQAFTRWQTWVYGLLYLFIAQPFYSLSLFVPTIITSLGYQSWQANLLSVPPYALGFLTVLITAWFSDRTRLRSPYIVAWMTIVVVGYIILLCPTPAGAKYFAIFLTVAGASPCISTAITYVGNNLGPIFTRAAGMGLFFSFGNSAGLISSNIYPDRTAPDYYPGHSVALATAVAAIVCALILGISNRRENHRRDREYGADSGRVFGASEILAPEMKKRLGQENMTDDEIISLGDKHPTFRYIW